MFEEAMTEPCQVHTDIGMLTLIPLSTNPSLQMLHPHKFSWIDIEKWGKEGDVKNLFFIFIFYFYFYFYF